MGKTLCKALYFILIPLTSWAFDPFPKEKAPTTPPNPYDLSIGWWDYYAVDHKELIERKKATDEYFEKIKEKLTPSQKQQAAPYFEQIDTGLTLYIRLKEATPNVPEALPPEKNKYTYQEWLDLSKSILEQKEEKQYLDLRLNLAKSSYKSSSNHLDLRFSEYLKGSSTDPNRLLVGLEIIQSRIYLSIENIQISNLTNLISQKQKKIALLEKRSDEAYERIDFKTISYAKITQDLNSALEKEAKAKASYLFSYEKPSEEISFTSLKSEHMDQKLLNIKLDYEIARVEVINLEIQREILGWIENKAPYSRKEFRKKFEEWRKNVNEIQGDIASSETSSDLILQQSLKTIALQQQTLGYRPYSDESLELAEKAILKIEQLKNVIAINSFLLEQISEFRKKLHFSLFDWFLGRFEILIDLIQTNTKWFSQTLFKIGEFPITPFAILKFIIVLVLAFVIGKFARFYIIHFGRKQRRIPMGSVHVLSRVFYYFVIVIGFLVAGYSIGFNVTIFAYVAGALAIWVGFGLQSIFHNFISGIIVLGTNTLRINDIIEIDTGEIGTVTDLNLRTTVMRTFDGKDVIIPNADIVNKKFYNLTLSSYAIRLKLPFRISLNEDKQKVEKIVIEAAKKVPITSEAQEPELWITGYGENFLSVELVVWINTLLKGRTASWYSQYFWAIDDALKENGISIPIPMQDIQIQTNASQTPKSSD